MSWRVRERERKCIRREREMGMLIERECWRVRERKVGG